MVNYSQGKVYKIESMNSKNDDDVYFGSTTKKYLSQRMDKHRATYKYWKEKGDKRRYYSVFELFEKYGVENCRIVLLENVNAESKDQLVSIESQYIRNFACVNKNIPNRKKNEYYNDNKEKNYEKSKQKGKKYYEANKEVISEKRKEKVTCECGSICRKIDISSHKKTIKHIDFINNQNSNPI